MLVSYWTASQAIVERLHAGTHSVLISPHHSMLSIVHCLVMLQLEPAYRTLSGFTALFLKDFLPKKPTSPLSSPPLWLEFFVFLNIMHSLVSQQPFAFEFNSDFLLAFADLVYFSGLRWDPSAAPYFLTLLEPSCKPSSFYSASFSSPLRCSPSPWNDYLLRHTPFSSTVKEVANEPSKYIAKNLTRPPQLLGAWSGVMQTIQLFDGFIWSLPESWSSLSSSLATLNLDTNRLTSLPACILSLSNLTSLSFSKNKVSIVPNLRALSNLQTISATRNVISFIDELPPSLTALHVGGNNLSEFPPHFTSLTKLRLLDCGENNLSYIPGKLLLAMSSLEDLNASSNHISVSPSAFPPSLTRLDAEKNGMVAISPALFHCTNLTRLDLSKNNLRQIPEKIGQLKQLKRYLHSPHLRLLLLRPIRLIIRSLPHRFFLLPFLLLIPP